MKKIAGIFLVFNFFSIFAQNFEILESNPRRILNLAEILPTWQSVIGGKILSDVVLTKDGFSFVTDGRQIFSCSENGKIFWQKNMRKKISPYFCVDPCGIFYCVAEKNLFALNETGKILFSIPLEFAPIENPFIGRDGRIFLKGKNDFCAYGRNQIQKFHIKSEEFCNIPILEFADGSLLLFLKSDGEKFFAKRFSPFGELLGTIFFESEIQSAFSCDEGILLAQKNGNLSFLQASGKSVSALWTISIFDKAENSKIENWEQKKSSQEIPVIFSRKNSSKAVFIFSNEKKNFAVILDKKSGKILTAFFLCDLDLNPYKKIFQSENGIFFCNLKNAVEFLEDGTIFWKAIFANENLSQVFYTNENRLILCHENWTLDAFLISQNVGREKNKNPQSQKNYDSFFSISDNIDFIENPLSLIPILNTEKILKIKDELKIGNYGEKEAEWISALKSECARYEKLKFSAANKLSYFDSEINYAAQLFSVLGLFGTDIFSEEIEFIIKTEKKSAQKIGAINSAAASALGNEEKTLQILLLCALTLQTSDKNLAFAICDATFDVCKILESENAYKTANKILLHFFSPVFSSDIQDYSQKTLKRLTEK